MKYSSWAVFALLLLPAFVSAEFIGKDPVIKYQAGGVVEILLVPGHDNDNSGAVFRGQREADMNLILAEKLKRELSSDPNVFVTVTRDASGYYPPLAEYLEENRKEIFEFIDDSKKETSKFLEKNDIEVPVGVTHNNAPSEVAFTLYGINHWIAEESFDMVIHIHFNDDTSHWGNNMGEYGGYTIYVPEQNLLNADKSVPMAQSVGREIKKTFFPSNLPIESEHADEFGLVPDFKLIALGSNRTLEIPSMLVEYSYIYEPHVSPEFLGLSTDTMARATAKGVFNLLSGPGEWKNLYHVWKKPLSLGTKTDIDTLALQFGLKELGFYPPKNHDRESCPFTGIYGPCTQKAVKEFQRANSLIDDGLAGSKTLGAMNSIFGF